MVNLVGLFGQVAGGNGAILWVVLGVIAAALPARRASRLDPAQAIRM
jgi:ABC-type antimicrobial peptide transport system permease subunit